MSNYNLLLTKIAPRIPQGMLETLYVHPVKFEWVQLLSPSISFSLG